jgi:transcriptional regulator with XRE-family HTH domain
LARRLDLRLTQAHLAIQLGVHQDAIRHWEAGDLHPNVRHLPGVIKFLGYDPQPPAETLGQQIRRRRRAMGMSREECGRLLGVSRSALHHWENDLTVPTGRFADLVNDFLRAIADASESSFDYTCTK